MTEAGVAKLSSAAPVVRRTYQIRKDQDEAIQSMQRRTGDAWSVIVRRLLDHGIPVELDAMAARGVPDAA